MLRGALGYGITENLKVSLSAPVVFTAEPLTPSRMSAFTPMTGDIEGLFTWRFHRQDTGVGSRVESAVIGGVLIPGPQEMGGALRNIESGVGGFIGGVTGFASRSNYFWVGGSYQRYAESAMATRGLTFSPTPSRTHIGRAHGGPIQAGTGEFSASSRASAPAASNGAA